MKREYDFSKGKLGPVAPSEPGKSRITIRLDNEVLDHFRKRVHETHRVGLRIRCRKAWGSYHCLLMTSLTEKVKRRQYENAEH
jgi:hypothetical protein